MVEILYTTYNSVHLIHYEIYSAEICKGGIMDKMKHLNGRLYNILGIDQALENRVFGVLACHKYHFVKIIRESSSYMPSASTVMTLTILVPLSVFYLTDLTHSQCEL